VHCGTTSVALHARPAAVSGRASRVRSWDRPRERGPPIHVYDDCLGERLADLVVGAYPKLQPDPRRAQRRRIDRREIHRRLERPPARCTGSSSTQRYDTAILHHGALGGKIVEVAVGDGTTGDGVSSGRHANRRAWSRSMCQRPGLWAARGDDLRSIGSNNTAGNPADLHIDGTRARRSARRREEPACPGAIVASTSAATDMRSARHIYGMNFAPRSSRVSWGLPVRRLGRQRDKQVQRAEPPTTKPRTGFSRTLRKKPQPDSAPGWSSSDVRRTGIGARQRQPDHPYDSTGDDEGSHAGVRPSAFPSTGPQQSTDPWMTIAVTAYGRRHGCHRQNDPHDPEPPSRQPSSRPGWATSSASKAPDAGGGTALL